MNPLGFNLLAWSGTVSDDLFPVIDRLKSIGYDGVEFFMASQDEQAYRRLGRHLQGLGMASTAVLGVGPDENPVSPDAAVRQRAVDRIKQAIDHAAAAGATVLCGPYHSAFATFTRAEPTVDEYKRSAEVLAAVGDHAAQAKVVLAVEALNRFECYLCNTMTQLRTLVDQVGHPQVRAMFDTHHANIEEKTFAGAIRTIRPVLAHVHISENDRGTPGAGHVKWDEVFATLHATRYEGWLTIEAFTRADPGFANAINVWRNFSETWDIAESGYRFIRQRLAAASAPAKV
jgi:D-psicose/D-tagatose/L-ribulose 3-epimerase